MQRRPAWKRCVGGVVMLALASMVVNCLPIWGPSFADWPVDPSGYTIETLPVALAASFVRGNDVYLALADGEIFKADDLDLNKPWVNLSSPWDTGPRMIFSSSTGAVFTSANGQPLYRTADSGLSWRICLQVPVWRMDEDDKGDLYAGNYTKDDQRRATLYKSSDDGISWMEVFRDERNHHIHTVRWDDQAKRLYIAYGDSIQRGQAYSDDRGETFIIIEEGLDQGHTDVACTSDYLIWASDDQSGRIYRVNRESNQIETLMGRSQFMWFAVAKEHQIYVGTMVCRTEGGERAALLASSDQGNTWQKLLETTLSAGAYDRASAHK